MTTVTWPDHLLTLDDWAALPEDTSRRYELVEGVLLVSPRPAALHQRAMWRLAAQLEPGLPGRWGVLTEPELVIESRTPASVRVPDLVVVQASGISEDRVRWEPDAVAMVVEILSPGSLRTDRVMKFAEYAEAGIDQYWIVDLDAPVSLTAFRLVDGAYENSGEFTGEAVLPFDDVTLSLDLDALTTSRAQRP
ncbi:Uma2 family endonuclease [Amycolatopsis suaedae]|uniref:Uma2 family endonuclease n=1 Tax=Amycolatopsis suaedae TaxID=2510978 RepID=A0A4Q7IYL9_9PSEU|nr:Uma2 family endonuclease [Amycolatopsis suaedae]RZQ59549.1 Uma2 family endonuclease [Amycolatopsis suaedae]